MNFDDLRFANPAWLVHPIVVWSDLDTKLSRWEQTLDSQISGKLRQSGWQGPAAEAALAKLGALRERLSVASIEATAVVTALRDAMESFEECKASLESNINEALAQRFEVVPLGTVTTDVMPDGTPIDTPEERTFRDTQGVQFEERFASSVSLATTEDVHQAGVLGKLRAVTGPGARADALLDLAAASLSANVNIALIPKDPKASADWWRGLTDEQREMYLLLYPQQIGATDGLPSGVRDKANRDYLDQRILQLRTQTTFSSESDREKRDTELGNLQDVRNELNANANRPPQQQLMLLKFDGTGQGRIIFSVGNPDTAQNVAVYVPGTEGRGDHLQSLNRAVNLQAAADSLTPGVPGDVATIVWMDYDAPDDLTHAALNKYSDDGAPRLDAYLDGLRANAPDQHLSVVGHSYGSVVVGDAARTGNGLAVDDIIVAGSPGMHVDSADDLKIDPRHVWAQQARGDFVPDIGQVGHGGWTFRNGFLTPSEGPWGGNIMTTDGKGHGSYWNEGSLSLNNQAAAVMGQYERVELQHGKVPT